MYWNGEHFSYHFDNVCPAGMSIANLHIDIYQCISLSTNIPV